VEYCSAIKLNDLKENFHKLQKETEEVIEKEINEIKKTA
jgi:hypothetical protein